MTIRILTLATLFISAGFAHAAPTSFKGYCMVVQRGRAPGAEVDVSQNSEVEFHRSGDMSYTVRYGNALNQENVFQIVIYNHATQKQSMTNMMIENEFPLRIDHVSELGTVSCMRYKE